MAASISVSQASAHLVPLRGLNRFSSPLTKPRAVVPKVKDSLKPAPVRALGNSDQAPKFDLARSGIALALSAALLAGQGPASAADFDIYYGKASCPLCYLNDNTRGYADDTQSGAYTLRYPTTWTKRAASKIERGDMGVDVVIYNKGARNEAVTVNIFDTSAGGAGLRKGQDMTVNADNVLNILALSDLALQEQLETADEVIQGSRTDEGGRVYLEYQLVANPVRLISVTTVGSKLFACTATGPKADVPVLKEIVDSFTVTGVAGTGWSGY
eukprot:jgi/Mesvir1/12127/Mv00385-RA.1